MTYDEIVKALRFTDSQTYLKDHAEDALKLMALSADAIVTLKAENEREKNGNEFLRAERDELHKNNCKLRDTNKALESDRYNAEMNFEHLTAEFAPFREAAAEYGIDAQTMLTLAKSQIATARENVRLTEENAALKEETRWISVNERLPEDDSVVLTYRNRGIDIDYYNSKSYRPSWEIVTHWKPLPAPPEKG